jgi:hypothetical protein
MSETCIRNHKNIIYEYGTRKMTRDFHFSISSRGEESPPHLTIYFLKWFWYIRIPNIVKPIITKVYPTSWNEETKKRLGRDYYENIVIRKYGIYLYETHFNIMYGAYDTQDSNKEQRWSCLLPWEESRFVRHSYYDLDGKFHGNEDKKQWDLMRNTVPKRKFKFLDFDGEEIEATTYIEERQWKRGVGYFKWLSFFYSDRIRRSLDLSFNKEVGKRKGSWKGGTIGHGVDMVGSELHLEAFQRYCKEHNLTFISEI